MTGGPVQRAGGANKMAVPDFFIAGPPKAGTTALHSALAGHPELFMSPVKEPKYYLCDNHPPANTAGPGDAHSAKEWVWRREDYEALFADAPAGALRGESTPFYLSDIGAQARILMDCPQARFIVILRDPIDRAYSNWVHLWSDGLEPESDFVAACALEERRRQAGWAPFWRYRALGLYGQHLKGLTTLFPNHQVHWLRYRELVDEPDLALNRICDFLGVASGVVSEVPSANVSTFVQPTVKNQVLQTAMRAGASVGRLLPPQVWRTASVPLLKALKDAPATRPELLPEQRVQLLDYFTDDVELLESVTGDSFRDWLGESGRGAFTARQSS
ncbi:MAG: sulfotransferase [Actinomycetes bacterium]